MRRALLKSSTYKSLMPNHLSILKLLNYGPYAVITKHLTLYTLKTIPGVGGITAATIFAEIEDAGKFPSDHQLTAYAGLDASVFQSGKFKASKNKISKRGSGHLRRALVQAAMAGVRKTKKGPINPLLSMYYSKKVVEGKPKMVALVATANKLLRIIYGMWRKNEPFKLD